MAGRFVDVTLRLVDKMSTPLNNLGTKLGNSSKQFQRAGREIQRTGKQITSVGTSMTKSLTVPIAGAGAVAVKTAATFEQSMSQVAATLGKTGDDVKGLSSFAQEMGRTTAFSASEAADGINILAQAGLKENEIYSALPTTLNLAAAGNISMAESAKYVTASVAGFGDTMENASTYADMIAKGATLAKTDVSALGTALGDVSATANSYNQTANGTTTALLRLAQANVVGSEAATGLSAAMTRVYAPTDKAQKAMDKLGISAYDKATGKAKDFNKVVEEMQNAMNGLSQSEKNAYAKTIFGTNRLAIYNAMCATSSEKTKKFSNDLNEHGSAEKMAKTQLENLNGQITILKSALEGIAISFGNKLLPVIKKITEKFQGLAEKINNLSDDQVNLIVKVAGVVAAIGPAVAIFGKMITVVGLVVSKIGLFAGALKTAGSLSALLVGAISSPVGIAVAVVGALVAVGVLLVKNWDKVKETAGKVFGFVKKVFNDCTGGSDKFKKSFKPLTENFKEFANTVKSVWKVVSPILAKLGSLAFSIFKIKMAAAIGGFIGLLSSLTKSISGIINGIMDQFNGIIKFIKGVFTLNWKMAWEGIKQVFSGIVNTFASVIKAPINAVISIINGAISGINKIGVKIPKWVPTYGGRDFSINIPTIPTLAKGTNNWQGGVVQISERGGEIVDLPSGSRVYPHDKSVQKAYNDGVKSGVTIAKLADQIIVREEADIDKIANALAEKLEKVSLNVGGGEIGYVY